MNKARLLVFALLAGAFGVVEAQTTFYLDGYGRTNITNDRLSGELIEDDSSNTASKGVGGYTLFDLGVNLEKNKAFQANAILRVSNNFGLFYGQGAVLNFRQLRLEGVIGKGVKYELGDIDVKMTPYTLWNSEISDTRFESEIFSFRRGIQEYENFNNGNHWRLQGLQSYATVKFDKGIESLAIKGFGVRTNAVDQVGNPDRIMSGASLMAKQSDNLSVGINYVGTNDLAISSALVDYTSAAFTAQILGSVDLGESITGLVDVESGFSNYEFSKVVDDLTVGNSDIFFDAKIGARYNPQDIKLMLGYKQVGEMYAAPGAQTRRINVNTSPELFPDLPDTSNLVAVDRELRMYDRMTNEGVYNRSISTTFNDFDPRYNNINPYGAATANRSGLQIRLNKGMADSTIHVAVEADLLNELVADNNSGEDKRSFTGIRAGAAVEIGKLLSWEKALRLSAGYNSESTQRDGTSAIDLKTSLIDLGITAEVIESLDLMVGLKLLNGVGNEYLLAYDDFNQIVGVPTRVDYDFNESVMALGARFRFSDNTAITVNSNMMNYTNNRDEGNAGYKFTQWFFNFVLKF